MKKIELDLDKAYGEVLKCQKKAAEILLDPVKFLGENAKEVTLKDKGQDYFLKTDVFVEKQIRNSLSKNFPKIGFYGEETGQSIKDRYFWVVDPIDGTAVFKTGGECYSNVVALVDREKRQIPLVSVVLPAKNKRFLRLENKVFVFEQIKNLKGQKQIIEKVPISSKSQDLGEWLGCSFAPSKQYGLSQGLQQRAEGVFRKEVFSELGNRTYGAKDSRPNSGSSAFLACEIAEGERHFAFLLGQKLHDLMGSVFAMQAGCPVRCGEFVDNMFKEDYESKIIDALEKETLLNAGIFANPYMEEKMTSLFYNF